MQRSHRHTIMDGRVVTFAREFQAGLVQDPLGPYEVSASRNAVIIHHATITDASTCQEFKRAVDLAFKEMAYLQRCNGRPDDDDDGEPRDV